MPHPLHLIATHSQLSCSIAAVLFSHRPVARPLQPLVVRLPPRTMSSSTLDPYASKYSPLPCHCHPWRIPCLTGARSNDTELPPPSMTNTLSDRCSIKWRCVNFLFFSLFLSSTSASYLVLENSLLSNVWLTLSANFIVMKQASASFWQKHNEHYDLHMIHDHNAKSLAHLWYVISDSINKYWCAVRQVKERLQRGTPTMVIIRTC